MNPSIKAINDNLLSVDFGHLTSELVNELSCINPKHDDYFCFTRDGKVIINESKQFHEDIIAYLKILMNFEEKQLGSDQGFHSFIRTFIPKADQLTDQAFEKYVRSTQLNQVQELFVRTSNVENNRRIIQAQYIKGIKKPTGIDKIKKIFERKGV